MMKHGHNNSIVCSIAHQLSMTMQSTDCHRWSAISCLILIETTKAIQHLSLGKVLDSDAIPAEICKAGGQPMAEGLDEVYCLGNNGHFNTD